MYDAPPPSYNPASESRPVRPPASNTTLPPEPQNFVYEIKGIRNKPMGTLTLRGDSRLSRIVPTFTEGSAITGAVALNLQSRDPINSIAILVHGELVTDGDGELHPGPERRFNFFRMHKFVWRAAMGDPRAPGADGSGRWEESLKGQYYWPLSIMLPERLDVEPGGEGFRFPHTFTERSSRTWIEYHLELSISRGRFRLDDKLITRFGFFSMQQPGRPSLLRQLAYETNAPVPGPLSDPEGWHALEPVQIRGTIFGKRSVDAKCTVFIAKPLCYTRGTTIPCAMTLETDDVQAADILASTKTSAVQLQRCVKVPVGHIPATVRSIAQAIWWLSPNNAAAQNSNPHQRHLMGEIHLRSNLRPSTAIKQHQVEYSVAVVPFTVVAFKPAASTGPLCTQHVEIVTRYPPGPRLVAATPPPY